MMCHEDPNLNPQMSLEYKIEEHASRKYSLGAFRSDDPEARGVIGRHNNRQRLQNTAEPFEASLFLINLAFTLLYFSFLFVNNSVLLFKVLEALQN